jgi:hypothetical protein
MGLLYEAIQKDIVESRKNAIAMAINEVKEAVLHFQVNLALGDNTNKFDMVEERQEEILTKLNALKDKQGNG